MSKFAIDITVLAFATTPTTFSFLQQPNAICCNLNFWFIVCFFCFDIKRQTTCWEPQKTDLKLEIFIHQKNIIFCLFSQVHPCDVSACPVLGAHYDSVPWTYIKAWDSSVIPNLLHMHACKEPLDATFKLTGKAQFFSLQLESCEVAYSNPKCNLFTFMFSCWLDVGTENWK